MASKEFIEGARAYAQGYWRIHNPYWKEGRGIWPFRTHSYKYKRWLKGWLKAKEIDKPTYKKY